MKNKKQRKRKNEVTGRARPIGENLESRLERVKAFYANISDPTERLTIAAYEGDTIYARDAIAEGANVNAVHSATGMRVIHLAASGGYRDLVTALLETGKCDLTARDPMGRLPSDCAAYSAEDLGMAELLAEEEARQFREKGKDPRIAARQT